MTGTFLAILVVVTSIFGIVVVRSVLRRPAGVAAVAGVPAAGFALFRPSRLFNARLREAQARPEISRTGLNKNEAESLLDWLEAHGESAHLTYVAGEGFTIE
ncbi:MAG TPA: hypothetical protein VK395_24780 [Gemmataceae bacterium]|nr:hypothetical protein [Gemmataceae bacterium]